MSNQKPEGAMTVQDKLTLLTLAGKFDTEETTFPNADGEEKAAIKVTAKSGDTNLVAYIETENASYGIYPTTTDVPLNLAAINDVNRFCKLMTK